MASEWPSTSIGEVTQLVTKGTTPTTVGFSFQDEGINFVKVESLTADGRIICGALAKISSDAHAFLSRSQLQKDDGLFTIAGTIGRTAIVGEDLLPANTNQAVAIVRPDKERISPRYLRYLLADRAFTRNAVSRTVQSVQSNFSLGELKGAKIPLPSLTEQDSIGSILGILDDRIDHNRALAANLEAIARRLFKSWFVDFDPVRTKAAGEKPLLADDIAALFPDRFVESESGEVPEGWVPSVLNEIADIIDCLHTKKPDRCDTGRPFLQLNNIRDDGLVDMKDTYFIDKVDYQKWITKMETMQGDCVITNVGRVGAAAQIPPDLKAALGRNMTGIRCKHSFPFPTFIIQSLLSDSMSAEIERKTDTGTILNALNVKNIRKLGLLLPDNVLVKQFELICRPLRQLMEHNLLESSKLTQLRDLLLPRLISGKIRVSDAQEQINESLV